MQIDTTRDGDYMNKNWSKRIMLLLISLLAIPIQSQAQDAKFSLSAGVGSSDNIARTDANEIDETILTAGLQLDLSHSTKSFSGDVRADFEHRRYQDDTFDNDDVGSFVADASFKLTPQALTWFINDHFGTLLLDRFQPDTPVNRENFNRFSTGLDLMIRLGSRTAINLIGEYQDHNYEKSDTDNTQVSGTLSISRLLSPNRKLSLNGRTERIEFDDETQRSSYDRVSAYLNFSSDGARSTLSASLGVNEVQIQGTTDDGFFGELNFTRKLSDRTEFDISYDRRFSDAGNIFSITQDSALDFNETRDVSTNGDPFESQRAMIGLNMDQGRNQLYLRTSYYDEDYEGSNSQDLSRYNVSAGFQRELGSGWSVGGGVIAQKREFDESGRDDDDFSVRIGIGRRLSQSLSLLLAYRRTERDSSDTGFDFVENRYDLTVSYSPSRRNPPSP